MTVVASDPRSPWEGVSDIYNATLRFERAASDFKGPRVLGTPLLMNDTIGTAAVCATISMALHWAMMFGGSQLEYIYKKPSQPQAMGKTEGHIFQSTMSAGSTSPRALAHIVASRTLPQAFF